MRLIRRCWALVFSLAGCAHSIHQVHVSDFVPGNHTKDGRVIHAHAEQSVVLGLVNNTIYVDRAVGDFISKCPGGVISGITTEYMTSLGFLYWKNHIYLTGQCLREKPLQTAGKRF